MLTIIIDGVLTTNITIGVIMTGGAVTIRTGPIGIIRSGSETATGTIIIIGTSAPGG